ncbi:hypothetical protein J2W23_001474 [Variovorax boronicumulans]|uniref:hypothetical protein n=1 Tax=Variovorax boronicumulans TaxID=436515 RepID=UPI0027850E99|nr:hypothetical protein [Variovorax boronicumulans]MDQ0013095.1 hypothetical protein [Variovorax boronicumulans]
MKVGIHASLCSPDMSRIAIALSSPFAELSKWLEGEYGGVMEHLWIDLELYKHGARADGADRYPLRMQKRVSGRSRFGLPSLPDKFNVGHYSVRPNFRLIARLPKDEILLYVFSLLYVSTVVLVDNEKLGGFDAATFRDRFLEWGRRFA